MSLILEALRKLERDKPAPDRGVVVMTTAGLSAQERRAPGWIWLVLGVAGGLATALAILQWQRPPGPPSVAPAIVAPVPQRPRLDAAPSPRPPTAPLRTGPPRPSAPPPRADLPASAAPQPLSSVASSTPPAPPGAALILHAITIQDGRPVALINDRVLREGDEFDGVRVLRIGEAEVEIERAGRRDVLRF